MSKKFQSLISMDSYNALFKRLTSPFIIALVLVSAAVLFLKWDLVISIYLSKFVIPEDLKHILNGISLLGKSELYILLLFIGILFAQFIQKNQNVARILFFLWLCVLIPDLINLVLKMTFGRARPVLFIEHQEYGFKWLQFTRMYWSFPSGHTTTAISFALGLSCLYPRCRLILLSIACLLPISRVMTLQHYTSDVMIAAYLAFIEVWFVAYFWQKIESKVQGKI